MNKRYFYGGKLIGAGGGGFFLFVVKDKNNEVLIFLGNINSTLFSRKKLCSWFKITKNKSPKQKRRLRNEKFLTATYIEITKIVIHIKPKIFLLFKKNKCLSQITGSGFLLYDSKKRSAL